MSEHLGGAVARQHRDGRARHCAAVLIPQKGWTAVHSASRGYHTAFRALHALPAVEFWLARYDFESGARVWDFPP